jgi:hypothetical protein
MNSETVAEGAVLQDPDNAITEIFNNTIKARRWSDVG